MREAPTVVLDSKFTQEDLDNLSMLFITLEEDRVKYRKERLKEMESNQKELSKRSKELNKPILFEVAYHCYLTINKTDVGSEFLEKYKEWL